MNDAHRSASKSTRQAAAQAFYGPLAVAPETHRRVGWESAGAHRARLVALVESLGELDGLDSIIDVGCGEGDLYEILTQRGFAGRYTGEDILPHMVDAARARHPAATFRVADAFLADPDAPRAAALICSGALNTRVTADHDAEVRQALAALWGRAEELVVVDLAVVDRHQPGVGLARADIVAAFTFARTLAPVVSVTDGVIPGEARLVMRRSRTRSLSALLADRPDRSTLAELLLAGGEPGAARRALAGPKTARERLLRALANANSGHHGRAAAALQVLVDDPEVGPEARLHLAPLLWAGGDRAGAEHTLRQLASGGTSVADDARVHLTELLANRGDLDEARQVAQQITDAWMRREALTLVAR